MVSKVILRRFLCRATFVFARICRFFPLIIVCRASNGIRVVHVTQVLKGRVGIVLRLQVPIRLHFRRFVDHRHVNLHHVNIFGTLIAMRLVDNHGHALFRLVGGNLCICGLTFIRVSVSAYARGFFYRRESVGTVKVVSYRVAPLCLNYRQFNCFFGNEAIFCIFINSTIGDNQLQ